MFKARWKSQTFFKSIFSIFRTQKFYSLVWFITATTALEIIFRMRMMRILNPKNLNSQSWKEIHFTYVCMKSALVDLKVDWRKQTEQAYKKRVKINSTRVKLELWWEIKIFWRNQKQDSSQEIIYLIFLLVTIFTCFFIFFFFFYIKILFF